MRRGFLPSAGSATSPSAGVAGQRQGARSSTELSSVVALKNLVRGKAWSVYDFDLRATVGCGTFGRVRMVKFRGGQDRTPMALKIMKKSEIMRLKQVEHVKAEAAIMNMIEHPFIINFLTTFQDDRRLFILMEFANGGELFTHLRQEGRLSNEEARFLSGEMILAFECIHAFHVVYRDLKPENVVIDVEGHLKLTDFGFAKVVEDRTFTLCGTPEYLAPEIIQSKGHGRGVDWWALGVLIFEMIAGYPPFYDESPFGIYQKVLAGRVDFPRHFDVKAKDIVRRLLVHDRAKRYGCTKLGAEELKKHKWFKGMDWEALLNRRIEPFFIPPVKSADDTSLFDRYPESTEGSAPAIAAKDQELFEGFSPN